jgi:hypothetical protein
MPSHSRDMRLPNTLIIEGHGATRRKRSSVPSRSTFSFKRSRNTKCAIYSYVREGVGIDADESNRLISWCINNGGAVPTPYFERIASNTGGKLVREREIFAIDWVWKKKMVNGILTDVYELDWNEIVPETWGADTILLPAVQGASVECIARYNGAGPRWSSVVWFALRAEEEDTPLRSVKLSTVLNFFNTQSYAVLWMVCRVDD